MRRRRPLDFLRHLEWETVMVQPTSTRRAATLVTALFVAFGVGFVGVDLTATLLQGSPEFLDEGFEQLYIILLLSLPVAVVGGALVGSTTEDAASAAAGVAVGTVVGVLALHLTLVAALVVLEATRQEAFLDSARQLGLAELLVPSLGPALAGVTAVLAASRLDREEKWYGRFRQ